MSPFWLLGLAICVSCGVAEEAPVPQVVPVPAMGEPNHRPGDRDPIHPLAEESQQAIADARKGGEHAVFDQYRKALSDARTREPRDPSLALALGDLEVEWGSLLADRDRAEETPGFQAVARTHYEAALDLAPNRRDVLKALIAFHDLEGDFAQAVAYADRLLNANPNDAHSRVDRGRLYLRLEQPSEALEDLAWAQRLLELAPVAAREAGVILDPNLLMNTYELMGRAYLALEREDDAEAILKKAVAATESGQGKVVGPDRVGCPFMALGSLYEERGLTEEGAAISTRAAALETEKYSVQLEAAQRAYASGDRVQALVHLERALALTDTVEVQLLRERYLAELEAALVSTEPPALDASIRAFDQYAFGASRSLLADVEGDPAEARVVRGLLALVAGDFAGVEAVLGTLADTESDHRAVAMLRGQLAISEQQFDVASRELARAADGWVSADVSFAVPATASPYAWLIARMTATGQGWLLANERRHGGALGYFDAVLARAPADVFALLGKANAHNAAGDLATAQSVLEELLVQDPGNAYALSELALVALNQGRDGKAEEHFRSALEAQPEHYTCPYEGLGLVYLKRGEVEAAAENFQKAIAIDPNIEYRKYNELAQIYIDQGRHDEARVLLSKSIENYPYDREAQILLETLGETPASPTQAP